MMSRRTRAATAAKTINGIEYETKLTTSAAMHAVALSDGFISSPKRKDCKLDRNCDNTDVIDAMKNGKRNVRQAKKHQQSSPLPITSFFHSTNGKMNKNPLTENGDDKTIDLTNDGDDVQFVVNSNDFPALPVAKHCNTNGINLDASEFTAIDDLKMHEMNESINGNCVNVNDIASPARIAMNGDIKQTTPHRIVALSPSKKQRLYAKNTVEVFSNLNIGNENGSPRIKPKTPSKRPNQRTRRKLDVNGTENTSIALKTCDIQFKEPAPTVPVKPVVETATEKSQRSIHDTQMTDFFPIRRSVRKTKKAVQQEQEQQIEMAIKKQLENGLVVKTFPGKGRGVIAGRQFSKGEFVVEYIGDLIEQSEADRREEAYAADSALGCYMYYFRHKEQTWCIDATAESGKLGRLVNHSRNGNLMTKIVTYKNRPHLVLIAKEDIKEGEELTYDYGDRRREALVHHPWLAF